VARVVERARLLVADVDRTWAVLAAFDSISTWAPAVDHSCALTTDEAGLGATRRIQVGRMTLTERVIVWEPPSQLAYRIEGFPARIGAVTNAWSLEAAGGSTRVVLTTTVDIGPRPPERLLERVVARRLATSSDQLLDGLEARLLIDEPRPMSPVR
jgi:carbon monoxide dehydrogenase subunit G